jgi:hypothetical protein
MLLTRAKRLLTDKELEEYLQLADYPVKQKKYLDKLKEELFEQYEWEYKRKDK